MNLSNLRPAEGSKHSNNFRVGRGHGSGNGKTAGKGHKGQNARSGGGVAIGFEGGQTPLFKRIPKRGFTNYTRKEYAIINVESLNAFEDGAVVNFQTLKEAGMLKKELDGFKVLGCGELTKKLTVQTNKFSASAKESIEKVGGKAEVI